MAKHCTISLIIITQACVHFWGNIPLSHGQRQTTRAPPTSTLSSFDAWSTTTAYRSLTVRTTPRGSHEDDLLHYISGGIPTRRPTTTTRRPIPDLDYHDRDRTRRPAGSTSMTPSWLEITTTTRRYTWDNDGGNYGGENSGRPTFTERPTNNNNRYDPGSALPSANFTVADAKKTDAVPSWNASTKTGKVDIKTLRQFELVFTCNASYPIEWLSKTPFLGDTWKNVDEIRHFQEVILQESRRVNSWQPPPQSITEVIYTIILTLAFDQSKDVPNQFELRCARVSHTENEGFPRKETVIKITKNVNATLLANFSQDAQRWSGNIREPTRQQLQYRGPRGKNVDCDVSLQRGKYNERFGCTSRQPSTNLTVDYTEKNCYDYASCERQYSESEDACWNVDSRNSKVTWKNTEEMWAKSPPSAGVIFCQLQEYDDKEYNNRSAALHFFRSLAAICPEDNNSTRELLHIASSNPLGIDTLTRDFVSFCWTPRSYNQSMMKDREPAVVYAGQNITVTCIASLYYFASGTRIGIMYRNYHRGIQEYVKVIDPTTVVNKEQGCFNYTAKVHIKSVDVSSLFCENYLKQSSSSVRKTMRLQVKVPTNITFVGGVTPIATYDYYGQAGFFLSCNATGEPTPKIIWTKEAKAIPAGIVVTEIGSLSSITFPVLTSPEAVKELHGTYNCQAENGLDMNQRTFHVVPSNSSGPVPSIDPSLPSRQSDEGSSLWFLWVILPILTVVVLAVIGFLVWKIKVQSKELRLLSKAEVDEFLFGKPEFLQHHSSTEEVNNYAPFLPYNRGYEIGKEQLEIDENAVLGSGAYAIVLRGLLTRNGEERIRVAIKTARAMDEISLFKALLSELKIMGFIGTHPNIVNLMGAHTKNIQNREIFIAIEFCENGNLLTYLRDHRNRFTNLVDQNGDNDFIPGSLDTVSRASFVSPENGLSTVTLIKWAYEIATGMEFLSQKKVIHGDLAARNILLNEHLVAKIGDFGLSRQLFEYANYIKKQQSPLPWKWLAIECLQDMRFSVKSDIWAYGIMLFEIFSLGQVPYPGHSYNDDFLEALINGKRPNRPSHATNNIYAYMQTCWVDKSEDRPNFSQVKDFFNKLLVTLVPPEYLDLHEKISAIVPSPADGNESLQEIVTQQSPNSINMAPGSAIGEDGKQARFSFNINTKTITALFHRN